MIACKRTTQGQTTCNEELMCSACAWMLAAISRPHAAEKKRPLRTLYLPLFAPAFSCFLCLFWLDWGALWLHNEKLTPT